MTAPGGWAAATDGQKQPGGHPSRLRCAQRREGAARGAVQTCSTRPRTQFYRRSKHKTCSPRPPACWIPGGCCPGGTWPQHSLRLTARLVSPHRQNRAGRGAMWACPWVQSPGPPPASQGPAGHKVTVEVRPPSRQRTPSRNLAQHLPWLTGPSAPRSHRWDSNPPPLEGGAEERLGGGSLRPEVRSV